MASQQGRQKRMSEKEIQDQIRVALSDVGVIIWRNNTGIATYATGSKVRYGLCIGSSDLIGITRDGKFVAIEVKTPKGKLTKEQKNFLKAVKDMGGYSGVARSVEDALRIVSHDKADHKACT